MPRRRRRHRRLPDDTMVVYLSEDVRAVTMHAIRVAHAAGEVSDEWLATLVTIYDYRFQAMGMQQMRLLRMIAGMRPEDGLWVPGRRGFKIVGRAVDGARAETLAERGVLRRVPTYIDGNAVIGYEPADGMFPYPIRAKKSS